MNENIQNKKFMLKELETLLSNAGKAACATTNDIAVYCEYMKQFYLSCSTNN